MNGPNLHPTNAEEADQPDLLPSRYLKRNNDRDRNGEYHGVRHGAQRRSSLVYGIPIDALGVDQGDVPPRPGRLAGENGDKGDRDGGPDRHEGRAPDEEVEPLLGRQPPVDEEEGHLGEALDGVVEDREEVEGAGEAGELGDGHLPAVRAHDAAGEVALPRRSC
jgi:hypothetical protein